MSNISFDDVKVGKFFVKGYLVREIVDDLDDNINYYTYILDTGEPRDEFRERCSKQRITKWAEREATPEEISRMQRFEARVWERNSSAVATAEILRTAPEEWILNEIQSRSVTDENAFISYSHLDKKYANRLATALEANLIKPWLDDRIDYGTQWPKVIQDYLNACPIFIVIMTTNAYHSVWVHNELSYAQAKKKRIFPLLREGELWLSLSATQYADVRNGRLPSKSFFTRIKRVLAEETTRKKAENND